MQTADWLRLVRMLVSALVAGAIGVFSNLLTAMQSGQIPKGAVTIAVITGSLLALKDIQAYLSQSPALSKPPVPPEQRVIP